MSKFYHPFEPAFAPGSVWVSSGGHKVRIERIFKYRGAVTDGTWDYGVVYADKDGRVRERDAWNFQCRYSYLGGES
jgi:hypothetical protein